MGIEQQWQNYQPNDTDLATMLDKLNVSRLESHSVLKNIKKNMVLGGILSVLTSVLILWVGLSFAIWQIQILLAIVLVFCIWTVVITVKLYRQTNIIIASGASLLEQLKSNKASVERYISVQMKVSLFVYPFDIAAGFLMGGVSGSGKSLEVFLRPVIVQVILGVVIIIFTPASYYLARYLFRLFFGRYLAQLTQLIADLEA